MFPGTTILLVFPLDPTLCWDQLIHELNRLLHEGHAKQRKEQVTRAA
jgi:hypothetical protein